MARWVMKLEVEAHLGIAIGTPRLVFKHPKGRYEVYLENHAMDPGLEAPLLHAHILFDADTLEDADLTWKKPFRSFLDFLALVTGARFRGRHKICLFDWTPGITVRHGYLYNWVPNPDLPLLALSETQVAPLEALLSCDDEPDLMRALHWFRQAVAAEAPDEQFQLFWFSLETMTRFYHPSERVPDRCAKCRDPLYCRACEDISTHRPYPTQAIQGLFTRHVKNDADRMFTLSTEMRHALLHGDEAEKVEKKSGVELSKLVDVVGEVAWAAVLTAIVNRVAKDRTEGLHLDLIKASSFLHRGVGVKAHVSISTPGNRDPEFSDLLNVKLETTVGDFPAGAPSTTESTGRRVSTKPPEVG